MVSADDQRAGASQLAPLKSLAPQSLDLAASNLYVFLESPQSKGGIH